MRAALLLVIAALLFILPSATGAPERQTKLRCMDEATRERMRAIFYAALDQALQTHFSKLFDVWMKDGDYHQPRRIANGLHLGGDAYLVTREYLQHWSPELCR